MPAEHTLENHGPADPSQPPLVITFHTDDYGNTVTEARMNGCSPEYVLMNIARLNYEMALARFGDPCQDIAVAEQLNESTHKMMHVLRDWSWATQELWRERTERMVDNG